MQAAKRFIVAASAPGMWNLLEGVIPRRSAAGPKESTHEAVLRRMVRGRPVVPEVCTAIRRPWRCAHQKAATGSGYAATSMAARRSSLTLFTTFIVTGS
ncbi:MAG: hypothetical protein LKI24_10580 [Acidipropionibacterium sp.]|jgi:hypothetical protein|nr:hypothetical protein [Acidipropionibacterium sp.]